MLQPKVLNPSRAHFISVEIVFVRKHPFHDMLSLVLTSRSNCSPTRLSPYPAQRPLASMSIVALQSLPDFALLLKSCLRPEVKLGPRDVSLRIIFSPLAISGWALCSSRSGLRSNLTPSSEAKGWTCGTTAVTGRHDRYLELLYLSSRDLSSLMPLFLECLPKQ